MPNPETRVYCGIDNETLEQVVPCVKDPVVIKGEDVRAKMESADFIGTTQGQFPKFTVYLQRLRPKEEEQIEFEFQIDITNEERYSELADDLEEISGKGPIIAILR